MTIKVFVLGRPGSGKSTAARVLNRFFQDRGCTTRHINDYDILKQMFLADHDHQRFLPTPHNGFDAIDLSVFAVALYEVERLVNFYSPTTDLITIEFARDDYHEAFQCFTPQFLHDAYVLFMDADLETCLHRVHERTANPQSADDHPSYSDERFRYHYHKDHRSYMLNEARYDFNFCKLIKVVENTDSLHSCLHIINLFAHSIWKEEILLSEALGALATRPAC